MKVRVPCPEDGCPMVYGYFPDGESNSAEAIYKSMAEMMFDVDDIHFVLGYGGPGCALEHATNIEQRANAIRSMAEEASLRLKSQGAEEEASDLLVCVSRMRTAVYRLKADVRRAVRT